MFSSCWEESVARSRFRVLSIFSLHIEVYRETPKMAGPWPSWFRKFLDVVTITRQKSDDDILETNVKDPETVNLN